MAKDKNSNKHNIPLNLYSTIAPIKPDTQQGMPPVIPYSIFPFTPMNPYQFYPPKQSILQQSPFNPLLYQWPLMENIPNVPNNITQLQRAARKIQAIYRGFSVRKVYRSLLFNPIMKKKKPDIYLTEEVIYHEIENAILDLIADLSAIMYLPLSRNLRIKPRIILNSVEDSLIHDAVAETLDEIVLCTSPNGNLAFKWDLKLRDVAILNMVMEDVIRESVQEHSRLVSSQYIRNEMAIEALDIILEQILEDDIFPMLFDNLAEDIFDEILMAEVIKETIFKFAHHGFFKKLGVRVLLTKPRKKKAHIIDSKMNTIFDECLAKELVLQLTDLSNSKAFSKLQSELLISNLANLLGRNINISKRNS